MAARRMLIQYPVKPGRIEENERHIAAVFDELAERRPAGLRYLALRLDDGSFVHYVDYADGAGELSALASFRAFRAEIAERCLEPPQFQDATVIGDYRPPEG